MLTTSASESDTNTDAYREDGNVGRPPLRIIFPAEAALESRFLSSALESLQLLPGCQAALFGNAIASAFSLQRKEKAEKGSNDEMCSQKEKEVSTKTSSLYHSFVEERVKPRYAEETTQYLFDLAYRYYSQGSFRAVPKVEDSRYCKDMDSRQKITGAILNQCQSLLEVEEFVRGYRSKPFSQDNNFRRVSPGVREVVFSDMLEVMERIKRQSVGQDQETKEEHENDDLDAKAIPMFTEKGDIMEMSNIRGIKEIKSVISQWEEEKQTEEAAIRELDRQMELELCPDQNTCYHGFHAITPRLLSSSLDAYSENTSFRSEKGNRTFSDPLGERRSAVEAGVKELEPPLKGDINVEAMNEEIGTKYRCFVSNAVPHMPVFPLPRNVCECPYKVDILSDLAFLMMKRRQSKEFSEVATKYVMKELLDPITDVAELKAAALKLMEASVFLQL